ncbi:TIM23 complex subunit [Komagataella phaffii CBS 7435]|uniref:Mitochondrial import inner membrane translocase subunit TIM50 n=2 Tax=Komagataella phaffii TaxID=460519 RepID=C4R2X4_KOMPG|nr:Constituent of the mitochondrial inner membrane presequence translocase (TIM23 complex) [Komagataella phaffii GS115]AOA62535.1 GQ67_01265T0 [Komagataella phaffii]CAH2447595.1 TIM23 complex subunit [Komagataella phaffii CBS 7435]AOA67378.1 GQ68_00125T0 [Komagataella phaffii GS115]CAY69848.1 Constituent of the mitochondrial inner membrane presequence translocase (TIM23 complex) [Komagataella phaffii GS115]SCV11964.1 TIM23 complex subunit [Komagataella phaffii CBS 7435]
MFSLRRNISNLIKVSGRQTALIRPAKFALLKPLPVAFRNYATEKKDEKFQSILNDDLLAQAGVDLDAENSKSQEKKPSSDSEIHYSKPKGRKNISSIDQRREQRAKYAYFATYLALLGGVVYMARDWDETEPQYKAEENGYTPLLMWNRFYARFNELSNFFTEPAFDDLLPPPPPEPYRRPLTLVLTLDDLLIHSDWNPKTGWKTAKRPGLDYFLCYLSQYYEIVCFSSTSNSNLIIEKIDPYRAYFSYDLPREAGRIKDGKLIKDLSLLNRDLGKTVIIDVDPDCYSLQPENAIPMEKWDGKRDDKLVRLIPFLEYLATQPIKDVRPVLSSYGDKKDIPEEFARREAVLRKKWDEDWEQKNKHLNANNLAAKLLGAPSVNAKPKMPLDIIREAGQQQYLQTVKFIKEHGEKALEENNKLMAQQKFTLEKIVTEGLPKPEDIARQQQELQQQQQQQQ